MKKLTKAIASGTLALGIALGVNVAGAQAAEASTVSYWPTYYNGQCWQTVYINYDWWEETFQGKRDTSIRLYPAPCIRV